MWHGHTTVFETQNPDISFRWDRIFNWLTNNHYRMTYIFRVLGNLFILMKNVFFNLPYLFKDKKLLIEQMDYIGFQAIPLVVVVSFFAGGISTWQVALQFGNLVPLSFLGTAAGTAITLEVAPVLTGLVIAGRTGTSIAAEVGTMRVTEQIDAIESLAVDPIRFLALPRIVAAIIMLPVLVVFADIVGLFGSYVVAKLFFHQTSGVFFEGYRNYFSSIGVFIGLGKSAVFGLWTALIGFQFGFTAQGGAKGVGRAAIKSFVVVSVAIFINDYIITSIVT
jgi:phospholipid/cholesterol/gamma-HCH transport system permease protein